MRSPSPNVPPRPLTGVPVVMTLTLGRPAADPPSGSPVTLSFADLFTMGAQAVALSPAAVSLSGCRVRLVGFVAQMTRRPKGGFYLCPQPLALESADGRAGLPPEAVRVKAPDAANRLLALAAGAVEVIGRLDVGYRKEANGEASWIRLTAEAARVNERK